MIIGRMLKRMRIGRMLKRMRIKRMLKRKMKWRLILRYLIKKYFFVKYKKNLFIFQGGLTRLEGDAGGRRINGKRKD